MLPGEKPHTYAILLALWSPDVQGHFTEAPSYKKQAHPYSLPGPYHTSQQANPAPSPLPFPENLMAESFRTF